MFVFVSAFVWLLVVVSVFMCVNLLEVGKCSLGRLYFVSHRCQNSCLGSDQEHLFLLN